MRHSLTFVAGLLMLLALPAAGGAQSDPGTVRTLEGTIVEVVTAAPGEGPVELLIETPADRLAVRLAPQRYLTENRFGAETGDRVRLEVRACPHCGALVAASAENLTSGAKLDLRGNDGLPLWRGAGQRGGKGCRRGEGNAPGQGRGTGRGHGRGARDGSGARCARG